MTSHPPGWKSLANDPHQGRLALLLQVAIGAGRVTLEHFRTASLQVEAKADDSPVTIADRSAEQWARAEIAQAYPDDTVQGEEFAEAAGTSRYRWIIDPIDGTKSFICGVPLYSTLVALELDDEPIAGVIQIPALGETVIAATGYGAWYRAGENAEWQRAQVSQKSELSSAVVLTSQTDLFAQRGAGAAFAELERACWVSRTWGDGYGYLLVATGRAELMVDACCNAWDVAAMLPILSEAGGRFTAWNGAANCRGGDGLGSNGLLHEQALQFLASGPGA